jgi:hypothetical protein
MGNTTRTGRPKCGLVCPAAYERWELEPGSALPSLLCERRLLNPLRNAGSHTVVYEVKAQIETAEH